MIEKLKVNYSSIEEIKIVDIVSSNNTFNTFWKGVERDVLKRKVKDTDELEINDDTERSTDPISIDVNVTPVFKEEENGERLTETNDSSIL